MVVNAQTNIRLIYGFTSARNPNPKNEAAVNGSSVSTAERRLRALLMKPYPPFMLLWMAAISSILFAVSFFNLTAASTGCLAAWQQHRRLCDQLCVCRPLPASVLQWHRLLMLMAAAAAAVRSEVPPPPRPRS
jgi:hypothetical protein